MMRWRRRKQTLGPRPTRVTVNGRVWGELPTLKIAPGHTMQFTFAMVPDFGTGDAIVSDIEVIMIAGPPPGFEEEDDEL